MRGPLSLHIGGRMTLALFLCWPIRQHRRSCLFARVGHAVCRYVWLPGIRVGSAIVRHWGGICFVSSTSRARRGLLQVVQGPCRSNTTRVVRLGIRLFPASFFVHLLCDDCLFFFFFFSLLSFSVDKGGGHFQDTAPPGSSLQI
ncbi:hypothetical protein LY78DRAFT_15491 [Colletotrichum sublineola]|nr:hypothetical protein LY78DRAFT_15491 [Colletotrichum sublineola]